MIWSMVKIERHAGHIHKVYCAFFREREKKVEELKKVKNKFEEGMWNVNTVLMGGLGRDPVPVEGILYRNVVQMSGLKLFSSLLNSNH